MKKEELPAGIDDIDIEAIPANPATKTDLLEIRKLLEEKLHPQQEYTSREKEVIQALLALYDSTVNRYNWLFTALAKTKFAKKAIGKQYKELLITSFATLAKEILSLLSHYEIEQFQEGGKFNPRRHRAIAIKETTRPELDNTIAEVHQRGFHQRNGNENKVFRAQVVTVHKYKIKSKNINDDFTERS